MGLFSSIVNLLENTVETTNLSYTDYTPAVGDVLHDFHPSAPGVFSVKWHVFCTEQPSGVAIKKNGVTVFAPATIVVPDGGYTIQVALLAGEHMTVEVLIATPAPIYSDLIITQIG